MFEILQDEEREEREVRQRLIRDAAMVVAVLVVIGAIAYVIWRPNITTQPATSTPAPTAKMLPPDVNRDLEIVKAVMGKDVSGLRVMWSVKIRNKSNVYTYSNLKYEVTFIGPDGRPMYVTADTIRDGVEPGGLKTIPEFVDGMYNSSASTYNFRVVGADAQAQKE